MVGWGKISNRVLADCTRAQTSLFCKPFPFSAPAMPSPRIVCFQLGTHTRQSVFPLPVSFQTLSMLLWVFFPFAQWGKTLSPLASGYTLSVTVTFKETDPTNTFY